MKRAICSVALLAWVGARAAAQSVPPGPAAPLAPQATPSQPSAPATAPAPPATAPATAPAYSAAPDDVFEAPGEVIVVTSSRAPEQRRDAVVATRVVARDELIGGGARTAAQALAHLPGVWIGRGVGGAEAHLAGLGGQHVLVLVDGQRQLGRVDGVIDLDRFSTLDLEQIEVTSGPSSVLYGSDALAGVIHLVSRRPTRDRAEAVARTSSLGATELGATAAAVHGALHGSAVAQWRRAPAIDRDESDLTTTISAYDERRAELRLGRAGAGAWQRGELTAAYTWRQLDGISAMATGAVLDRRSLVEEARVRAAQSLAIGATTVEASASAGLVRDQYLNDQRGGTALDQAQDTREAAYEASALAQRRAGAHHVGLGVEGIVESLRSPRLARHGARQRLAVFAQDRWELGELAVVPAARLDVDSRFGAHATPRLAALWRALPGHELRASLGLGYRAPSFKEQLLRFENAGAGYVVEGNPDLAPETSRAVVAGWRAARGGWALALDASWNELRSMIGVVALPSAEGEPLRFGYRNVARARTLSAESHLAHARGAWSVYAGAAAVYAKNLDDGEALPQVPRVRGRLGARWRDERRGLSADVELAATGARALGADMASPRRVDVRARLAKSLGKVTLELGGDNLLDAGDARLDPSAPRSVYLGLAAAN